MKVLSLNLHCFQEENYQAKLDKVADFIRENEVDVCLFQEAAQLASAFKIDNQIRVGNNANYIASKLNYHIYFHPYKLGFAIYEEGLAIISRLPITNCSHSTISKTNSFNSWLKRELIWADIGGFTFFNTHLGWDCDDECAINQIKNNLYITCKREKRFFLAGDFNYPDNSAEIKIIKKDLFSLSDIAGLDSYRNPTFHRELDSQLDFDNNKMIDFIFTNLPLTLKEFSIVFNNPDDYVSDHSGLYFAF